MANFINGNFLWGVQFSENDRRLCCRVQFIFGKEPIINPAITDQDFFLCEEFGNGGNSLLAALEKSLEAGEHATWAPSGYDVFLEILPYPRNECLLEFYIAFEGGLKKREAKQRETKSGVVIFRMIIKQDKMRRFYKDLQKEYKRVDSLYIKDISVTKDKEISDLEKQFDQAMREIYRKAKQHDVKGDTLIQLIEDFGGRQAAKYILSSLSSRTVIRKLMVAQTFEKNALNLFVESLVADPKWKNLFTEEEIEIAKERVAQWK